MRILLDDEITEDMLREAPASSGLACDWYGPCMMTRVAEGWLWVPGASMIKDAYGLSWHKTDVILVNDIMDLVHGGEISLIALFLDDHYVSGKKEE